MVVILLLLSPLWNRGQAMPLVSWTTVEVASGDTLWQIAKQTQPDDTDIRDYIAEIISANDMNGANIKPGQRLLIPIR